MEGTRKFVAVLLFGATVALAASCGGGSSGTAGATDGEVDVARAPRSDSAVGASREVGAGDLTTTTLRPQSASTLEGVWTAQIQDLVSGGAAAVAGRGLDCSGSQTVTFRSGQVRIAGQGTCRMGPMEGSITYDSHGEYSQADGRITVRNFEDSSVFEMNGTSLDSPVGEFGNGTVGYSVSGNTLVIDSDSPEVGPVSQTYTRVS